MKIYVAGPYSGDNVANVRRAIDAADEVMARGHIVFLPHLTAFWDLVSPKPYKWWLRYDEAWLLCCDAVLRLDGESNGADGEVKVAEANGMPVFYSVEDLPVEVAPFS